MLGLRHLPLLALSFAPARCELPGDLRPEPLQEAAALKLPAAALRLPLHADSRWVLARVQIGEREVLAAYDTGLSVRALIDDRLCTGDGACQNSMGAFVPVEGALCRNLGGEMRCTVRCSGAVSCEPVDGTSASECISGYCDTP